MSSKNATRVSAETAAAQETPAQESVIEQGPKKPRKQLSALLNYILTSAELQGFDRALKSLLEAVDVVVNDQVVGAEEIREVLKKSPQFRVFFIEEERARIAADPQIAGMTKEIEDLSNRLNAVKIDLKTRVETVTSGVFTYGTNGIQPVQTAGQTPSEGSRGKRFNPRLSHYEWDARGSRVTLDKEGQDWVCKVNGMEYARSESFTKAVEGAYASAFGLVSSMSVPRIARMREQEAEAGLPPAE